MNGFRNRWMLGICLVLVATTAALYGQVCTFEFINHDDPEYVSENPVVQRGLTWEGLQWAFTTIEMSNWHPLTWMSHMLDAQLFGMNAGAHHLINVFFHLLNSALLLMILHRMTGALWRSAFVAALFALHPLHVESVAWISERKDVLSTFFGFMTIWAYARYADRPGMVVLPLRDPVFRSRSACETHAGHPSHHFPAPRFLAVEAGDVAADKSLHASGRRRTRIIPKRSSEKETHPAQNR